MKNREKRMMQHMVASIMILCIILMGLLIFSRQENNERQMRQINEYISELSSRTAQHVGDVLADKQNAIESIAYLYGQAVQGDPVNQTMLKKLEASSGFDLIRYVNPDGESFTSDGKIADVGDRDYSQNGNAGLSGMTVVLESRFSHEKLIGFYAPVWVNEENCGVMVGFLNMRTVSDILQTTLYGQAADTLIVGENGEILGSYTNQATMNVAQLADLFTGESETQQREMTQALSERSHFSFNIGRATGYLTPIRNTSWSLMQLFPASVATTLMDEVNRHEHTIMLLFSVAAAVFFIRMAQLLKQKNDMEQKKENMLRITTLLQNVADDYICLMDVNLNTQVEEQFRLYQGATQAEWAKGRCDYARFIQSYAADVVCEQDRERFLEMSRLDNLRQRLQQEESCYLEYDALIDGRTRNLQAKFVLNTEKQGEQHILIGIRDVTALTKERLKHRTRMNLVVTAASTVYPYIMEINLTKDRAHTIYDRGIVRRPKMEKVPMAQVLSDIRDTIVYPEELELLRNNMSREAQVAAFERGERELTLHVRQRGDDGEIHWMEVRNILMQDVGSDLYSISMIRCIDQEVQQTEEMRRAKEAAESASRAKSTFLFNMSHDIRTPMNAIMGFSSMAEKYLYEPEKLQDCLAKINLSGEHLLRLINNVLNLARIESGKLKLDIKAHHIPTSVSQEECIFQADVGKKNLHFSTECDVQDEIAFFDALKINQVTLNLIGNAVKYTPEGGTILYRVRQLGRDGEYGLYECSVMDNGIGMSPEFLSSVFDAFERENSSFVSGIEGTGLGLAITRRIVEELGGQITCRSEPGKGSEFCCTYRFRIGTTADLPTDAPTTEDMPDLKGKRVLLVEDNVLNREISRELLESNGMVVDEADDGNVAVEKVKWSAANPYDVILMDVQMPTMNGYEATRAIRALDDPQLANIPIIAVTANAFEEDRRNAMEAGMNGHVSKPVGMKELQAALRKCLG